MRRIATVLAAALGVAVCLGTPSAGAATTPPARPYTTHSLYESSTSASLLYAQGCFWAQKWPADARGVVILDFGRLAYSKTYRSYGTYDFGGHFDPTAALLAAAESYAAGFHACHVNPFTGRLRLAVGTSNYGPGSSTYHVPRFYDAGVAFGDMVNQFKVDLAAHGYGEIAARTADDAEAGWDPGFTATHNFLSGYAATTPRLMYDYGGLSGGGWWTNDQAYFASRGAGPTRPFPEVYYSHHVSEWEGLAKWAVSNGQSPLGVLGVMSQYPNGGYSPQQGYDLLLQALQSEADTTQTSIMYSTVIRWAEASTSAGRAANGMASLSPPA